MKSCLCQIRAGVSVFPFADIYGIHCMMQLEALPPIAESGISVTE